MFLGVVTIDTGYTVLTGTEASAAVTEHIDYDPGGPGLHGWMGAAGRAVDRWGGAVAGPYEGFFEMLVYGILTPLLVAMPLAWEAHRRQWSRSGSVVLLGLAGLAIGAWLAWKYPDIAAVYYAMVNVTLLASEAIGVSYYAGSLLYFVILPVMFAAGYGAWAWIRGERVQPPDMQPTRTQDQDRSDAAPDAASEHAGSEHVGSEDASASSDRSDGISCAEGRRHGGFA